MTFSRKPFVKGLLLISFILEALAAGSAQPSFAGDTRTETIVQEPQMRVDTARMDFGIVPAGQKLSKRLEITNSGREILRWHGFIPKDAGSAIGVGRYVSLVNDEVRHSGVYKVPAAYRDVIELSGPWLESAGHPVFNIRSVLKYQFFGSGLRIFFWKEPDVGKFSVYVDHNFITEIDNQAEKKERADVTVAENLPMGQHTLTIVGKEGKSALEGFEVYGKNGTKGPTGWLTLLPASGVTTREIDYVTVVMNTQKLSPGLYGEVISFTSNGGTIDIPVSVEIINDQFPKSIDIYRYASGNDYLFTANPQLDEFLIINGRYIKEGIAFRLFVPGTPGTVEFYRWYNPLKKSHYYSHNKNDAAKIEREYVFEGAIGNIATTRLRNARELYRWFNPKNGFYYYSMDIRGNGIQNKGYRFDGISGYVR